MTTSTDIESQLQLDEERDFHIPETDEAIDLFVPPSDGEAAVITVESLPSRISCSFTVAERTTNSYKIITYGTIFYNDLDRRGIITSPN